nr:unnamed protein product [Callosobruchus analis]
MSDVENEEEAAGLRQLILKRSQVKGKLTRFVNYLDKVAGEQSTGVQLEIRLEQAVGTLHIFNEIQDNIEYFDESEIESSERFAFEENSLRGEALATIENMKVTSENYQVAWDLLKSRYENSALIKKTYIADLCSLPSVTKDVHSLRKFNTSFQKHVRSLKSLGEPVDQWSSLLIYLMTKKLDSKSNSAWQEQLINYKIKSPSLENFIEFLNDRCQLLESTSHEFKFEKSSGNAEFKSHNRKITGKTFVGHASQIACHYCNEPHPIYFCKKLQNMPVADRIREIAKLDICKNCLRKGHNSSECRSRGCRTCGANHNSMLHAGGVGGDAADAAAAVRAIHGDSRNTGTVKKVTQTSGVVTATGAGGSTQSGDVSLAAQQSQTYEKDTNVLLPTAIVLIKDSENRWHECRALLDSGSQPNFVTRKLSDRLHLKSVANGTPVMGVGATSTNIKKKILTTIKSRHCDYTVTLTFLELDQITVNMPSCSFDTSRLQMPTNISLADPQFNKSSEIDLLIGATVFFDLLGAERTKLGTGQPILQQSVLGWIIAGPLPLQYVSSHVSCNLATTTRLETQIERFWSIEEVSGEKPQTLDEKECEKIFSETTRRNDDGHFVVQLPAKRNAMILADNLDNAKNRLRAMERKFAKNSDFKNQYKKMGNLPKERVIQSRPFSISGVDLAGPFSIKDGRLRNRAIISAYLCIFVCFSTKAVHLEAVVDLSTDSFLNCLHRFVSRRGLPRLLYCDNATNFVGTKNKLSKMYELLTESYEALQQSMQRFWMRWSSDYLHQLQARSKWTTTSSKLKEGDLVLLIDDDTPPLHWKRGRIIQLHAMSQEHASVYPDQLVGWPPPFGISTRAVQKLAVLPVDNEDVPDQEVETPLTTFQGRRNVTPVCDAPAPLHTRRT